MTVVLTALLAVPPAGALPASGEALDGWAGGWHELQPCRAARAAIRGDREAGWEIERRGLRAARVIAAGPNIDLNGLTDVERPAAGANIDLNGFAAAAVAVAGLSPGIDGLAPGRGPTTEEGPSIDING